MQIPTSTKDFIDGLMTWGLVMILSIWGGMISYIRRARLGSAKFNIVELIGEISTSAFVGVITFNLCQFAGFGMALSAALVGIAGHMGSRGLYILQIILQKRVGITDEAIDAEANREVNTK